jgi:hypothetical protein
MNIIATRINPGEVFVTLNGVEITPAASLKHVRHSPTGFEYGYMGSGPSQLAFAILLKARGEEFARENYQAFKCDFVSQWQDNEIMIRIDLDHWLESRK